MKTLQNNFTTPEQSKRLLELGLPADSADMYYVTYKREGSEHEHLYNDGTPLVINIHRGLSVGSFRTQSNLIPCWSVGRLMEIYVYLTPHEYVSLIFNKTFTPMDKIIAKLENGIANGMLDFSKLED